MLMHNSFFVFSLYRRHLWPSFIFWAQPCVLAWAPFTCGFRSAWTENESIRDPKNTKPKRSVLLSRTINIKIYCSRFFLVPLHFSQFPHLLTISINDIKSTSSSDSKPGFSLLAPQTSFLAQVGSCHQVNNLLAYQFHI